MRTAALPPVLLCLLSQVYARDVHANLTSKRGLAYQYDSHEGDNELLISDDSPISWYYTWSMWPAEPIGHSVMFVPMVHGLDDATGDELHERLDALPRSSTHLLTFNEPDGETHTGGSSVSPEDAAEAYIEHIVPLRDAEDRRWVISHPVVTGSPQGLDWLRDFNESCYDISDDGCPTDFVAVHWYGEAEGLRNWLEELRDFYSELAPEARFWVTELALPQGSEEETLAMLNQSTAYLDGEDDVEAYAWFGAFRTSDANDWTGDGVSFFDEDGGLTDVGSEYLGGEDNGFETGQSGDNSDESAGSLVSASACALLIQMVLLAAVVL
ncbi:glycosyl hydrolase catalytic core-domain-containing protein [Stachybotrys elegans]|uniref:Glycosyl hydrolase catalytic core-domain-containing protein n=1 Tax=Stachybotrys elegans TaxID=80388 RepID=A0A8K0WSQ8_9HYPO|nr:glycosyl hydrolase catalytic core-domain-containing protein [Stachybotrys elegans]